MSRGASAGSSLSPLPAPVFDDRTRECQQSRSCDTCRPRIPIPIASQLGMPLRVSPRESVAPTPAFCFHGWVVGEARLTLLGLLALSSACSVESVHEAPNTTSSDSGTTSL